MSSKRVEKEWQDFKSNVIHKSAPPDQIREMKLAFYGGASALLMLVIGILDPSDREPTEEDLKIMDEIYEEIKDFADHGCMHYTQN